MKKYIMKAALCIFLCMLYGFFLPVSAGQEKTEFAEGKTISLSVGKSKTVSFKKILGNKEDAKIKLSDKKVVKIIKQTKSSIVMKGRKKGSAKLTIISGNEKYTCRIKVKKPAGKITLSDTKVTMHTGEKKKITVLNYKRIIEEYKDKSLSFDIDDASVIRFKKVKDGSAVIEAVGTGKAVLTVTTEKEVLTCSIIVEEAEQH